MRLWKGSSAGKRALHPVKKYQFQFFASSNAVDHFREHKRAPPHMGQLKMWLYTSDTKNKMNTVFLSIQD